MRDVFERLKAVLEPYRNQFAAKIDCDDHLYLETREAAFRGRPMFFAAAEIGRAYVAFHLMPAYVNPELLEGISNALRQRMQGKSCFNFRTIDDALFAELAALTRAGFEDYQRRGFVDAGS